MPLNLLLFVHLATPSKEHYFYKILTDFLLRERQYNKSLSMYLSPIKQEKLALTYITKYLCRKVFILTRLSKA